MQPGEVIAQRFELESQAGEGGMGTVFRARDRIDQRPVAVKLLHANGSQGVARFAREAALLARLDHPSIVRYLAHGETAEGLPYLVTEWLEGTTLRDRLSAGPLPPAEALRILERVGGALAAAHRAGIVHRDLKPANVFLLDGAAGEVKLLDFGIARPTTGGEPLTATGALIGTPGYLAPEQARGDQPVDAAADVFSLGCLLYRCLGGRSPFAAEHLMAAVAKLLLEEPLPLSALAPDLPASLDGLAARMLAKAPEQRPALDEVLHGLAACAQETGESARPAAPPPGVGEAERLLLSVVVAGRPGLALLARGLRQTLPLHQAQTVIQGAGVPQRARPHAGVQPPRRGSSASPLPEARSLAAALGEIARRHRGRLECIADGQLLVTLRSTGAATDQAANAARCALELHALLPGVPVAVATARGELRGGGVVGEVADRGLSLLSTLRGTGIRADEVTATLLGTRFELAADGHGPLLLGERESSGVGAALSRVPSAELVGRDRELGALLSLFEEIVAESVARAVRITAPPGGGKSRLRRELVERLRAHPSGPRILTGQGEPLHSGAPFALLGDLLCRAAGLVEPEALERRRERFERRVGAHLPRERASHVAAFLGQVAGLPLPTEWASQLGAARDSPLLLAEAIRASFVEWVAAETAAGPLVVVLEDLHWGDRASIELIDVALRDCAEQPLLVVALARPEVDQDFPGLWSARAVQDLRLPPLGAKASERIVRAVAPEVDPVTLKQVVDRAAGNPFYLEELARAVAQDPTAALPETVLAMVQSRLEQLEPGPRRLLRAASIFGGRFWPEGARAVLGGDPELDGWLRELLSREVIVERTTELAAPQRVLEFRHALVRDAAYEMLTEEDRRRGHRLAAEWLATKEALQSPLAVAEHLERGGEPLRAVGWFTRAAEDALAGFDAPGALALADRAQRAGADGEALGRLRLVQASAHNFSGDHPRAQLAAEEASALFPAGAASWFRAQSERLVACVRQGRPELAAEVVFTTAGTPAEPEAAPYRLGVLARAAIILVHYGPNPVGVRLLESVDAEASALGPSAEAMLPELLNVRALLAREAGDAQACLDRVEQALERGRRLHFSHDHLLAAVSLTTLLAELGALERAEQVAREALAHAARSSARTVSVMAQMALGHVLVLQGRDEEARAQSTAALELAQAQHDALLEAILRGDLACIALRAGEAEAAEGLLAPVRARTQLPLSLQLWNRMWTAQARLGTGRTEEAVALAEGVLREAEEQGLFGDGFAEGEAMARLTHAQALHAALRQEEARAAVGEAVRRLLLRADRIPQPEHREGFLYRMPVNAQTFALAESWGVRSPSGRSYPRRGFLGRGSP